MRFVLVLIAFTLLSACGNDAAREQAPPTPATTPGTATTQTSGTPSPAATTPSSAAPTAPGATPVANLAPGELADCAYASETLPTILVLSPASFTLGSTAMPAVHRQESPGRDLWESELRPLLRQWLLSIGMPKLWIAVDLGPRGFANASAARSAVDHARRVAQLEVWQPTEACRFVAEPRIPPPFPRP